MYVPNDKIGPYRLVRKLGSGAAGMVWLAEKQSIITTTKVAIKLPLDNSVDIEVIKQEASIWVAASGHPNILPIIDADVYDGQVIIVSEYAPDGSLSTWLDSHNGKAPSIESAIEIINGVLCGLEHLHERKIIHRDIKPDNILLQRNVPRLADFGIARILKTNHSSVVSGTPFYMAPEAFDGKRTEQSDIWAVGVILYQLLKGEIPFTRTDIASLLAAIITSEPAPLPDTIPTQIKNVILKAIQKKPEQRYKSAAEMREELISWKQISGFDNQENKPTVPLILNSQLPKTEYSVAPTLASPTVQFHQKLTATELSLQSPSEKVINFIAEEKIESEEIKKTKVPIYAYFLALIAGFIAFNVNAFVITSLYPPSSSQNDPIIFYISLYSIFAVLGGLFSYLWSKAGWSWGIWLTAGYAPFAFFLLNTMNRLMLPSELFFWSLVYILAPLFTSCLAAFLAARIFLKNIRAAGS